MAWNPNYNPYYSFYPPTLPLNAGSGELNPTAQSSAISPGPELSTLPSALNRPSTGAVGCTDGSRRQYTYNLKIINPKKKSHFTVEKFRCFDKFLTPGDLKEHISAELGDDVPDSFDVGYYKGRGSAKVCNDDLKCMYDAHSKDYDQEIGMWCQGREQDDIECTSGSGRKRKTDNASFKPPSKRQAIRDEVEEIYADLREKHGSNYTAAQLRLWANMIQVGTHKDHDEPPKVPMFGFSSKSPKNARTSVADALAGVAEGFMRALKSPVQSTPSSYSPTHTTSSRPPLDEMGVSPGKCAALRSQYINQVKQLHQLLELTAITKAEYEEQKTTILEKMQKL